MALQQLKVEPQIESQVGARIESQENIHQFPVHHGDSDTQYQSDNCRACDTRNGCLALQLAGDDTPISDNKHIYQSGEYIYHEGDNADTMYVVRSGSVKSCLITEQGDEQVFGFYLPGDVLGFDGVGAHGRLSSAQAMETTSVCKLSIEQFTDSNHNFGILELVSGQMAHDHNLVLMLARKDADARVASLLCDLSHRFERHGYAANVFNLSMSRTDIGSYLGLALETVSRTFKRLVDAGVLHVERRSIEILNDVKLKEIAGEQVIG